MTLHRMQWLTGGVSTASTLSATLRWTLLSLVVCTLWSQTEPLAPRSAQSSPTRVSPLDDGSTRVSTRDDGWARHVIDASSVGADGVRLADFNRDGRLDIVTGWEEGGLVRIYLHPGPLRVSSPWPSLTVGEVASPEDAVFADLNGDGILDVLSATEGENRALYVHWAPQSQTPPGFKSVAVDRTLAWRTERIVDGPRQQWMFLLPIAADAAQGGGFFAGGKGAGAQLGWFEARGASDGDMRWRWHALREVGWLMSLVAEDMDGDGDADLLFTDRKGSRRGTGWLENPGGPVARSVWKEHAVGPSGADEVMFLASGDLDGDGREDIVVATKPRQLVFYRRLDPHGAFADPVQIAFPPETGTAKAVAIGDIDGDGVADLVFSCEHATGPKRGVMALLGDNTGGVPFRQSIDISGPMGTKFDLVQLVDLDEDGDLDVLTCEETENLGVIWYENPGR